MEAELSVPGHVLYRHESSVCKDDHVVVAVADEDAICCFDDLRKDVLYRVRGEVSFPLWAAAADEDAILAADGPADIERSVHSFLDIGAVEVGCSAVGDVRELRGEG